MSVYQVNGTACNKWICICCTCLWVNGKDGLVGVGGFAAVWLAGTHSLFISCKREDSEVESSC